MAKGKVARRVLIALAVVLVVAFGAGAWYVNDYYHADDVAMEVVADKSGAADGVEVRQLEGNKIAFVPTQTRAGLVFYPGAKVQPEAYAPLMEHCARRGILCVLLKPTFNLAILDMDAAAGVREQFPEVGTWTIAGHSMGGVAAADYLHRHEGDFDGIAFLASYPAADLTGFGGKAVSLAGTEDHVLKREGYEAARAKLPASSTEQAIDGGNHAYYGNYGEQAGDGTARISRESQQEQTADAIAALIGLQ